MFELLAIIALVILASCIYIFNGNKSTHRGNEYHYRPKPPEPPRYTPQSNLLVTDHKINKLAKNTTKPQPKKNSSPKRKRYEEDRKRRDDDDYSSISSYAGFSSGYSSSYDSSDSYSSSSDWGGGDSGGGGCSGDF